MKGTTTKRESVFGTDGVRDRAGEGRLSPESVRALAQAVAIALAADPGAQAENGSQRGAVLIGRDTRESGTELLGTIATELQAAGHDVGDLGVLPTPGVARAAATSPECCLAVVLSASHNPAEYNGIKLVSGAGAKISDAFEAAVTDAYFEVMTGAMQPLRVDVPGKRRDLAAQELGRYVEFLVGCCRRPERLAGRRVLLDTANGAAYRCAPEVFRRLGMDVEVIGDAPNGANINDGCGALAPHALAARVAECGASIGFCFDGDADRMIPIAAGGTVLDGDFVLALAGRHYDACGELPEKTIVGTVMSNVGLEKCLDELGLRLLRTPVGDRHVYQALLDGGHPIGGEQSGHLIFTDFALTGDGTLGALRLLDVLESDDLDLAGEARLMTKFPQTLQNVRVSERLPLEQIDAVARAVAAAEERLGADGRVLLRYSGTEPLARVMLEGPKQDLIEALCADICAAVRGAIGA